MDGDELTEQETALYDRQIRVWGAGAQRRYFTLNLTSMASSNNKLLIFRLSTNKLFLLGYTR
jgi:molybdopterin/thiamine biosynthesis adenylyltransferase